jgi:hypothetical protein
MSERSRAAGGQGESRRTFTVPTVEGTTSARDGLEVVKVRLARQAGVVGLRMEREKDIFGGESGRKGMIVGRKVGGLFRLPSSPWTRVVRT